MLSKDDHDYRIGKGTGSLAPIVMNVTDPATLVKVWEQKVGLRDPDPETYQMRHGSHCESLFLDERERQTGHAITRRGEIVDHPIVPDICVKLDGWRAHECAVIEAKDIGCFRNRDEVSRYYYAQVSLQMLCTGAERGYLVIGQGNADPIEVECVRDAAYEAVLIERMCAFILCMKTFTPPCALPPVTPPEKWRTLDVIEEPTNWSPQLLELLAEYDRTAASALLNEESAKAARALVPEDVGKVFAGQHILARDARGRVSIRFARSGILRNGK